MRGHDVHTEEQGRIALWNGVWSNTSIAAPHDSVIRQIAALPSVCTVMEVGAGSGRDLEELKKSEYDVFYTDISSQAVIHFDQRLPDSKKAICDAHFLPFAKARFDLVYCLGVLEHFSRQERQQLLREMFRVSKRFVLVEVPQTYSAATLVKRMLMRLGRWKYGEEIEFSYRGLVAEVQAGFPQSEVYAHYGRELVPLPRNFKLPFYRVLLPGALREAYLGLLGRLHFGLAGAFGVVFSIKADE